MLISPSVGMDGKVVLDGRFAGARVSSIFNKGTLGGGRGVFSSHTGVPG